MLELFLVFILLLILKEPNEIDFTPCRVCMLLSCKPEGGMGLTVTEKLEM
jgi:hypothetical protein